ncbi:non-ribosomal peptide synthetase [Fluviispira multicolorata]|uniref:Amino acid adenylation domain-containing protein n=1 Tax=Fluviispira multicolorata TaxID=2654512 RepID=A0A833JDA4_9BACT|nr:non-ribosomal peptide synthetase [Fluviispira multicolorata]KAB8028092.1 amino acid adenylation domain-containing protein [Fluviispira multicolorata]
MTINKSKIDSLSPQQRAELIKKLNILKNVNKNNIPLASNKIPKIDRLVNLFELSFAQKRLWFIEKLQENSALYNIPFALRLKGDLNVEALTNSFNVIIERHEALRTNFIEKEGIAYQVISSKRKIYLQIETIDELNLKQVSIEETHKPFNLENDILLRLRLLKISENDHVLLMTIHHIISDGWSTGVIINELSKIYSGILKSEEYILPELPIQYIDFSDWQKNKLKGKNLNDLISYWRNQLSDLPPILEMPTDFVRPSIQSYNGHTFAFSIEKDLETKLLNIGNKHSATLFMVTVSAFYILLMNYSKQNDITIGTTIANRNHRELENLIGFFVNTIALRMKLNNKDSFIDLLEKIRAMTLEAYENQDLPFEQLVKEIQPDRSLSHSPIFQVMFELQNAPAEELSLANLQLNIIEQELNVAKFDLTLTLQSRENDLYGILEFNTDLFTKNFMDQFIKHYVNLLKNISMNQELKIDSYDILNDFEKNSLINSFNLTDKKFPLSKCVHELFEEQVNKTPNRIAASCDGLDLTYIDLHEKSNQFAHYLRSVGTHVEDKIALYLDRGFNYLVSMLGVLKSGAAFVPLDPTPKDKRAFEIVEQCCPQFIITSKRHFESANKIFNSTNKIIKVEDSFNDNYSNKTPKNVTIPSGLAYLIFTSGSTGKPKGAMLEHKGMVNHLFGKITDLKMDQDDVVGQIAVQTFDVSIWQFICPLLIGGRTAIFTGDSAWEPKLLIEKIKEEKVTILESVPSHTKVILDEQEINEKFQLNPLRIYITNGEPLTLEQCQRWFKFNPNIILVNAYGATECSDDSHHLHIAIPPQTLMPYMPVKQPLPNQQTFILNEGLEPVPIGVRGEIYFGGCGVGRGYLNDPQKTAISFLPNPFSKFLGERLYKTGDIARRHVDGSIEFLGRSDFQVKIRGFRIEIGEIEARLSEHHNIASCVVLANKNKLNNNYNLIAYIIPKYFPAPTQSDIRQYCVLNLVEYMVPESYIIMDDFPLSSNGKVDRKKLPTPTDQDFINESVYVAPRNSLEVKITEVWSKVLGKEKIGIFDNFFKMGGHSLLAAEAVIKLQKELNSKIELKKLFEFSTIETLANSIQNDHKEFEMIETASVKSYPLKEQYDLAPCQIPEWYSYQIDRLSPVYNISFNDLFFKNLNVDVFIKAWQNILDRHTNFRIYFDYVDGKPVQKLKSKFILHKNKILLDYTHIHDEEIDTIANNLACEYSNKAFDFENGPLFVLNIVEYPNKTFQLLFVIHHIIWDETSTINLFKELSTIYNALLKEEVPELPELKLNYFDYSQWINESIQLGYFDKHKKYWLEEFKDMPPALNLPNDFPRPSMQTYNGNSISTWLPRNSIRNLNSFIEKNNVTLFMFMMSIIDLYFFRITGQKNIVIGSPIAGRDHDDFKSILGLFATPMPIRCKINESMTFENLLSHIKEQSLLAFEHHYYPCNLVIEELNHVKDLSRPKLFSVMYGVQNNKTQAYEATQFQGAERFFKNLYGAEANAARFDLTLVVDQWGSDIAFNCIYNTDIFKKNTIDRMLEDMAFIVDEVIKNSSLQLTQYSIFSEKKKNYLINEINDTDKIYEKYQIVQLLEKQLTQAPNSIAISDEKETFTYKKLHESANQLANFLKERGVKAEDSVALVLPASIHMVVSILAILKLSAHYVPISAENPLSRTETILEHANVKFLIHDNVFSQDNLLFKGETLNLNILKDEIDKFSSEFIYKKIDHDLIIYIIYTSGTTGIPKGIPIQNDGLINLILDTQRRYNLSHSDKVLMLTPYTFDASILDIFWTLSFGGELVFPSLENHKDPYAISKTIFEKQISIFQCVPIMLEALIETKFNSDSLRLVISGGAQLTKIIRDRFFEQYNCQLMNHYGPTEITVDASYFDCSQSFYGQVVPIGKPIGNVKIFIFDPYLNLVPQGVVGEIYISSPGLTKGYLNDFEKSKQTFIEKSIDGKLYRLYRSGDLGKIADDGNIYYLGRTDKQVKVRGNRVELEEITGALLKIPYIKNSIVKICAEDILSAYIEIKDEINKIKINESIYRMFTLAQRPELLKNLNIIHSSSWPKYFEGSDILMKIWPKIYSEFSEFQTFIVDGKDEIAAVGNSIPIYWDGTIADLPNGWDYALENAFKETKNKPNTLFILAGIVTESFQSKGLSSEILKIFKSIAKANKLQRILVAVRPTGKAQFPEVNFTDWCSTRREDGQLLDNWLRMHERIGGKILKIDLKSQYIKAKISDWESWTNTPIMNSGLVHLPETLQAAEVDFSDDSVTYYDPAVWVEHFFENQDDVLWPNIDGRIIKQLLNQILPSYMIPDQYIFLAEMPLFESGKINENALPSYLIKKSFNLEPAKTIMQKEILEIWKKVLKMDSIGISDDFFDLGGQSLKVIQMLSLLSNKYHIKIPLCNFYKVPTVLGLEKMISENEVGKELICEYKLK